MGRSRTRSMDPKSLAENVSQIIDKRRAGDPSATDDELALLRDVVAAQAPRSITRALGELYPVTQQA